MRARHWSLLGMSFVGGCLLPKVELVSSLDADPSGGRMNSGGSTSGGSSAGAAGKVSAAGAGNNAGGHSSGSGGEGGSQPVAGSPSGGAGAGNAGSAGSVASGGSAGAVAAGGSGGGLGCPSAAYDLVCGGACVISATDRNNCGMCSNACTSLQSCSDGKCGCSSGLTLCGGACVGSDESHCGSNCAVCPPAAQCVSSACTLCPTGCALINAPFNTDQGQSTFKITLGAALDLSTTMVRMRYYSLAPVARLGVGAVNNLGQEALYNVEVSSADGWGSLVLGFQGDIYDFSKTVALEVYVAGVAGKTSNPTKVYIDNISIDSGVAGPWDFASGTAPLVLGTSTVASTVSWVHP